MTIRLLQYYPREAYNLKTMDFNLLVFNVDLNHLLFYRLESENSQVFETISKLWNFKNFAGSSIMTLETNTTNTRPISKRLFILQNCMQRGRSQKQTVKCGFTKFKGGVIPSLFRCWPSFKSF